MHDPDFRKLRAQRLRPLAACIASLVALSAPAAMATNRIVSSCLDDGGLGTLRSVIAAPTTVSGDTVDMSGLDCTGFGNKIVLVSSGISVNQGSLTIKGPGSAALTIDASGLACSLTCSYRVLTHTGGGTLTLQNVGVAGGYERHTGVAAIGGCVASYNGDITLDHAAVSSCKAFTYATEHAYGGAVYAAGNVLMKSSTVGASSVAGSGITAGGGVFSKLGTTLDHSTISGNSVFSAAAQSVFGGGVAARGDLTIQTGTVSGNSVNGNGLAQGGGAFSTGAMTINYATLSGNTIESVANIALGGGARSYGGFAAAYSTIDGNQALGFAFAGGVSAYGSVTLSNSTISGNHADNNVGGLSAFDDANYANNFVTINNSTISGNSAGYAIGGIYTNASTVGVYNSTIVLNTATKAKPSTEFLAPGLALAAQQADAAITLQSTILSDNTYGSTELDLSTAYNQVTIAGSGNLIRTEQAHVPNDTSNACPLLGPLRNNGGLTRTHALASNSPALDSGNALVAKDYDQRGSSTVNGAFDYLRISGKQADIGAYELQQDDIVFTTSFEGCLPIN